MNDAAHVLGERGRVVQQLDRGCDVAAGRAERLPRVERLELGDLLGVIGDQLAGAPQALGPLIGREVAPGALVERALGGVDGEIDISLLAEGHLREHRSRGRVNGVERAAGAGGLRPPVDEVVACISHVSSVDNTAQAYGVQCPGDGQARASSKAAKRWPRSTRSAFPPETTQSARSASTSPASRAATGSAAVGSITCFVRVISSQVARSV